jgi:hypothetical protein
MCALTKCVDRSVSNYVPDETNSGTTALLRKPTDI